ncbi:MAG: peptidylprolyl isomerase [Proteobacteria bacterium]|nr:peptidylprolyl isomerase [Pseudomonadota bacterium]
MASYRERPAVLRSIGRLMSTIAVLALVSTASLAQEASTMSSVLEASSASDWRPLQQDLALYMTLDHGTVVIELAPEFAPMHVANIRTLVHEHYFDGLSIIRSQDNYVAQWGDPNGDTEFMRDHGSAAVQLEAEFYRDRSGIEFVRIQSQDAYADEVGFVNGFPVGRDDERAWLVHCYGMLGVGRGNEEDSGSGAELYVVTGHAPRHLDRNVTLAGRVVHGIEHLSSLPRGTGPLGFYEEESQYVPIRRIRLGSDLAEDEQLQLELLQTNTATFEQLVDARRYRREAWFADPTGRIGLCNVPLPVRLRQ